MPTQRKDIMISRTLLLILASLILFPMASFGKSSRSCDDRKNAASAKYHACLAKAETLAESKRERKEARCLDVFLGSSERAERNKGCEGGASNDDLALAVEEFNIAILEAAGGTASVPEIVVTECDLEQVELLDFEAWQREDGYWVGEYSFFGADGTANQSSSWPYRYDNYKGFIHLTVEGNSIRQRNVFAYPPQHLELCDGEEGEVKGTGECGLHGNEKIFSADQTASDCKGGLEGPFQSIYGNANTFTEIVGDDRVLYQVIFDSPPFQGNLMQSQLTTLPGNGTRVRTAQGFNVVTGMPSYSSFYRETKVSEEAFYEALAEARAEYNILEVDYCGFDGVTNAESGTDCESHFASE